MKDFNGEQYLDLKEVETQYGWKAGTVYYFRDEGLLELYKFVGNHRSYCKRLDLESIKNRPPELKKRGPKSDGKKTVRARKVLPFYQKEVM